MTVAENKARELANALARAGVPQATCFDPLTILALLSVILSAVQLLYLCTKNTDAAIARARNLSWWDRVRLRLLIRRELRNVPHVNRRLVSEVLRNMATTVQPVDLAAVWVESKQSYL